MGRIGIVSLLGLASAVVLYVAGNLWLSTTSHKARLDLTEHSLYTLSTSTTQTLADIDEPIELHLFYSQRLGQDVAYYATFARRVRELIREIANTSNGKVILHEHDPEPFSAAEDLAVAMGVQGIPIAQGGDPAYFGLAGINTVEIGRAHV